MFLTHAAEFNWLVTTYENTDYWIWHALTNYIIPKSSFTSHVTFSASNSIYFYQNAFHFLRQLHDIWKILTCKCGTLVTKAKKARIKSYRQQFCLPDQGRRHVFARKLHKVVKSALLPPAALEQHFILCDVYYNINVCSSTSNTY